MLRLPSLQILLDRLDHLVANLGSFRETRAEVTLDLFEFLTVAFHVAERYAVRPVLHCLCQRRVSVCFANEECIGDLREQQM